MLLPIHTTPFTSFFLRPLVLAGLLCVATHHVLAQTDDPVTAELLENFFRDNETASESDALQFLENLENWRNKPLNLNTISKEDLLSMHLLNNLQIENFLAYRTQFGPFLNEYELQAVPGWELTDIRRMLNFARIRSGLETRNTNILEGFYKGDNEALFRWGAPQPPNYYTDDIEGRPYNWALRYRHTYDNRLRFGFTAENDPGEALFFGSNRNGFDFYSAHLFIQNLNNTVKTVALGDFSARFGQGVLLQTGFSPGKSAETVSVTRGGRKLNAYGAFGEAFFFRGAATTIALNKVVEVTALYSDRRRDGNVVAPDLGDLEAAEVEFSSLQTSGLHRTSAEILDEKALRERVAGISTAFNWKNGQITANGLYINYDKPWAPLTTAYRRYVFQGKTLTGASLDYNWRYRNWLLFGETARSDNGGIAAVNGLLLSPDQHITLTAVHRSLGKDYQSVYGAPFAEVSRAANEQGLYLGADIRYIRRWQINVYADVWRHPWLRYGVSAPSRGREFLARVIWTKSRTFSAYALWQSETKERDSDVEGIFGLVENRRDRLRLHASYKVSPGVELRSRIEWTTFSVQDGPRNYGFIAYQEAAIKPLSFPLTATVRYAVYDTDNYDTRVFAFETDLFSAISIPALSGQGARAYLNLSWRVNKWLRLEGRFEQTNQLRAVTSTGATGKEVFWKLQARMRW
ncbi:MAG: helix-hairpin-helix domain-containing protein [Saprospiraceae bacterium]|nr:helix-hairpin-helix domain-containing protein [Saprospiraceae bacterium]